MIVTGLVHITIPDLLEHQTDQGEVLDEIQRILEEHGYAAHVEEAEQIFPDTLKKALDS